MSLPNNDQIWIKTGFGFGLEKKLKSQLLEISGDHKIKIFMGDPASNINTTDIFVTDAWYHNPTFKYFNLSPEFWGQCRYDAEYSNNLPTKTFNCFINRTDPMRQSWFYQLVRRNLIDEGHVSFRLAYRDNDYKHINNDSSIYEKQELYNWIFDKGLEIFKKEHNLMIDKVPFCNFTSDLEQCIIDSKISLVIETYFHCRDYISLTEKIFRQLQLPRPFVLYCNPGAIKLLRDHGFDVYDDYVDHSYDSYDNDIEKQVRLLDIIDNFRNISYNEQMLTDFEQRASHNRSLLDDLKKKWPDKLKKFKKYINELR